ncbi:hypothetical protein HCA61_18745 [Rhodococcus sp. HNM0563]|uniref:hypothetical protein n=1 Tax=Rhodococcus sp. HNM0563 TaxID=2716339 RepID=UPI00146AEC9B|nr:hypothetical protein [Rhodococcus sp. HNM0563]NLU64287.1 hypothetical protein [Rhodococcus sp. HNM0563]
MTEDTLLAGPRGRRLLLEFAREADRATQQNYDRSSFNSAVFYAAHDLDPNPGVIFGPGADEPLPDISPDEVARRLATVPLPEVTEAGLRSALGVAVDHARYWQEPDGEDILAATTPMRRELRRVAAHIAQSSHVEWWLSEVDRDDQWSVGWADTAEARPQEPREQAPLTERLAAWRVRVVEQEVRAERERPRDPKAMYSGQWWSFPWEARCSARSLDDGLPSGVLFVEDCMGWKQAFARRMPVPAGIEVFEIDGADAWADLCRRYPLEVTAQKRHDWYRTTGRDGRWVMPDWSRVAEAYGGVHLTVRGYLAAAGTAICVDDDTASVIAGWAPDESHWLTDSVRPDDDVVEWVLADDREHWRRKTPLAGDAGPQ